MSTIVLPSNTPANAPTPAAPDPIEHAFLTTAAARAALTPEEIAPINVDVSTAALTIIGAVPLLAPLRPLIAPLPVDLVQIDLLQTYAEALVRAQRVYAVATAPVEALPELLTRGTALRERLLADATPLARHGFVSAERLDALSNLPGYIHVSQDLGSLVLVLREAWSTIAARTAITEADLDEALDIANQITLGWGVRTHESATFTQASDDRVRAYTLMMRAYDEARRAVAFLRWKQGDAEKFTPSLYPGRNPKKADPVPPVTAGTTPAATDPTVPVTPSAPATPASPVASTPAAPFHPSPAPATPFAPPGARGSNPFTS